MTTAISSDIYAEHAAIEIGSGYRMTYNFGNMPSADSLGSRHITQVYPEDSFSYKKGYGFLTEESRSSDSNLKINEINDGHSAGTPIPSLSPHRLMITVSILKTVSSMMDIFP